MNALLRLTALLCIVLGSAELSLASAQRGRGGGRAGGRSLGGGSSRGSVRYAGRGSQTAPRSRTPSYGSVRHRSATSKGGSYGSGAAGRAAYGGTLRQLPSTARPVQHGGNSYYRVGGRCYQKTLIQGRVSYVGCRPPPGFWVSKRPSNYWRRWLRGRWYYRWGGGWWVEDEQDGTDGYQAVDPPEDLPEEEPDGPDPMTLLKEASDFLAARDKLSLEVKETMDDVLEDGRKLERSGQRRILLRRPAHLRVISTGGYGHRRFYFNGETMVLYDYDEGSYGSLVYQADVDAMLDYAAEKIGHTVPMADVIASAPYASLAPAVQESHYLGEHRVGNFTCHHLAFEGDVVDFEVWIEKGDRPVPRRFVITYKEDPSAPRYEAELYRWNYSPRSLDRDFQFSPPDDVELLEFWSLIDTPAGER